MNEKVLIVGVKLGSDEDFDYSMEELKSLVEAVDKKVVGIITQNMPTINKAYYIGSGKVREVKEYAIACEADEIIFDDCLSPSQIRNLVDAIDLPVSDRTNLILDIFALRARTKEAKLQVETARLQYMLPRLIGIHDALSRQGGASGSMSNKGTGEKQLELDRRKIEHRISELKKELNNISDIRENQRKKREDSDIPKVALVGYTNAGKSTILNHFVELDGANENKKVLEKDMLFATLETSVRHIDSANPKSFFLADTVGFIDKLPHNLIQAFRSTLMEVKYSDLLIHVVDVSDEHYKQHMKVTRDTLVELGAGAIPTLTVYNKADLAEIQPLPRISDNHIFMSAKNNIGFAELTELIRGMLYSDWVENSFCIPYNKGEIFTYFVNNSEVVEKEYTENGIFFRAKSSKKISEKYREYII